MPVNGDQTIINIVATVLLVLIVVYYLYDALKSRRRHKTEYTTRELLTCVKCDYRVEKDYETGDFIGLLKGSCPKCGGNLKVRGIYAVEKKKL